MQYFCGPNENGGLAQLARASALHAEGQRFESVILHHWFDSRYVCIENRKDLWHIVQSKKSKVKSWKYISSHTIKVCDNKKTKQGRMADALALGGDEGRDKLR